MSQESIEFSDENNSVEDPDFAIMEEDADEEDGFVKATPVTNDLEHNTSKASVADGLSRTSSPSAEAQEIKSISICTHRNERRRTYTFKQRKRNPRVTSKVRLKWNDIREQLSITDLEGLVCCKKLQCFNTVNRAFLLEKVKLVLSMSAKDRRQFLSSMITSNGNFFFDGKQVCVSFLSTSFHCSRDILSSIRSASKFNNDVPSNTSSCGSRSSPFTASTSAMKLSRFKSNPNTSAICAAPARESILSYLNRVAESTGDKMPDNNEQHLPFYKKEEVYKNFVEEFNKLNQTIQPPSKNYFYRTWKSYCKEIKIRKHNRFSKCEICENLKDELRRAVTRFEDTSHLLQQKRTHFQLIMDERQEYKNKRDKAILDPSSAWSLIIDGADQTAFGLPHFSSHTKGERGHALKVKLVGMLEHAAENRLRLLTMTEEHQTGANHIVESLHRFLMDRSLYSEVPPTLYLQFDNCTRENKNRFFLAYVECLVRWKVFKQIDVSFLPIGHTHEDIDQAFSTTSKRLQVHDAITLRDLQDQVRKAYNRHTSVSHMKHVINWSGLCSQEAVLTTKKNFSHYRYFKFVANQSHQHDTFSPSPAVNCHNTSSSGEAAVRLMVRVNIYDDWEHESVTFVKKTPNLTNTPPTVISDKCTSKNNGDKTFTTAKAEVTKRIESIETRIKEPQKIIELQKLRDEVFRPRKERFHWNLSNCIELRNMRTSDFVTDNQPPLTPSQPLAQTESMNVPQEDPSPSDEQPCADQKPPPATQTKNNIEEHNTNGGYTYDMGSFVAVLSDASDGHYSFWIGRITKVHQDQFGVVNAMVVHWYEPYARKGVVADKFADKYAPAYLDRNTSRQRPWTDSVDSSAVVINFSSFLSNGRLPSAVQKHLRTSLP